MNCMLCTAINKGNLSGKEKEKALGDVLNAGEMDTEPRTAEVPLLREKASQKETVNLKERVKGKVKVRIKGERVPRADALTVVVHTTHPIAQRARVKERQVSSSNKVVNPTHGGNRANRGPNRELNIQCLNPSTI